MEAARATEERQLLIGWQSSYEKNDSIITYTHMQLDSLCQWAVIHEAMITTQ